MKVAQVIDSLKVGGAQKLQATMASALNGHDVQITVISLRNDADSPISKELEARGIRIVRFPAAKLLDPFRISRLVRFMRGECFDAIQCHLSSANILGSLAARLTGTPCILTLHSAGSDPRYQTPARIRLENCAFRYSAQRIVAVGNVVADAHRHRILKKTIDVIPNAVPIEAPLSPEERLIVRSEITGEASRPLLISVGRLSPPKGYLDLLDAFEGITGRHSNAFLAIVGGGALASELEQEVLRRKLENHVALLKERNDVARLLAASDLYICASHWEGLPVSVLEAMAAGLPIVSTAVGDIPGVVIHGTGLLVPPRQPRQLQCAMESLLNDVPKMQLLGKNAREHVRRNYSPVVWMDHLMSLYREVGQGVHREAAN